MRPSRLKLKILLPSQVFSETDGVTRMVVETVEGSLGILPLRLDCVAALAPGILSYSTELTRDVYVAVDEGVLVKAGAEVTVSTRHAVSGADLGQLRQAVEREFLALDDREKRVRTTLAKLESGLIRGLAGFHRA